MDKKVGNEIKGRVKKEIEKQLHRRIYEDAVDSALKFRKEFKNQIVVAVTAGFAFLIALSWRVPIQGGVDLLIEGMGLKEGGLYVKIFGALVIILIGVLVLMGFKGGGKG